MEVQVTHTLTIHTFDAEDPRLGRHVCHDSRSLNYAYLPREAKPKHKSTLWTSQAPPLNQGELGSCTGNSEAQWLNTNFASPTLKKVHNAQYMVESDAVHIYSV